jgi:hypothetical protein
MKKTQILQMVILIVAVILSAGCAGSPVLGPASTANGLLRAVQGAPNTFMMASDKLVMVAWPQGTNYGFAVFTRGGEAVNQFKELAACCGTKADAPTMTDLVNHLKSLGWARIYALPAATAAQIREMAKFFGVNSVPKTFGLFLLPYGPAFEYEINPRIDG